MVFFNTRKQLYYGVRLIHNFLLNKYVLRYDYTGTMSQAVSLQDRQVENNDSETSSAPGSYINIEEDEFGESVCLSQLVAVANFMQANQIYALPTENFDQVTLYNLYYIKI